MRIKNWHRFQHFKDRRPLWIKLYRDILDDPEWHTLDPSSAKALVMLWLVASENGGELPTPKVIAFRLRMPEQKILSIISTLSHWLDCDDINTISSGYQVDALEKRREETEKRRDREEKKAHGAFVNVFLTDDEYEKLKAKFNGSCSQKIDALSEYMQSRRKKYADHYATILSWARRDTERQDPRKSQIGAPLELTDER